MAELVPAAALAQVGIRVAPGSPEAARIESFLGCGLPGPGTVAATGARHVLWLGPDEWLAVADAGSEAALEVGLRDAAGGFGAGEGCAAVVDLSANRVALEVRGAGARDVLAQVCPLDLHPRVFGPGRCAQSRVAKAQAIVWQLDDEPTFRLLVRPSFLAYVEDWLADAIAGETAARAGRA